MAFDQPTRNRLARFVGDARALLTEEFTRQLQREYGIDPANGEVADLDAKLGHLDDTRRATAQLLRETAEHYQPGFARCPARERRETLDRIVREQAFTVLNRLCALRMAEARGLLIESVGRGPQSKGFQLYTRLAGAALGETGDAYRAYLFSLFDELAVDLPVLFDRFAPEGRLFPGEAALLRLLEQINHPEIEGLWAEDETVGWVYQYFNSKEERQAMRAESAAPRNSRELAVRNQFFTPRYVVEFLADNTLGRTWYEMTRGETGLVDSCRYLVRRPNEVFLAPGSPTPSPSPTRGEGSRTSSSSLVEEGGRGGEGNEPYDHWDIPPALQRRMVEVARQFRKESTASEDLLWQALRRKQFDGRKFRRQQPIGPFVVDFYCSTERLIVEVDGPIHEQQREADRQRQSLLEGLGLRFVRLSAESVEQRLPDALAQIRQAFTAQPPLPNVGEGAGGEGPDLSQEELLRQTVYIPHRPLKDPRNILMLDPACGSMHFGLYAFDLFERIYEEAWEIEAERGPKALERAPMDAPLHEEYPDREAYLRDVPRLIVERNIHGVDIDPRAAQIAGLALWLRAQRSWRDQGVKSQERPEIRRSNVVCAEPMPGDPAMLNEFIGRHLVRTPEDQVIGEMLSPIFKAMELAGEAGSLLKIEEEIASVIEAARKKYEQALLKRRKEADYLPGFAPERDTTLFDLLELPNAEEFWQQAEERIYAALRAYAEDAEDGGSYRRRLFADDAAQGFAFIDLCRRRYDVVLMNPPFGAASASWKATFEKTYPRTKNDLYAAFVEHGVAVLWPHGMLGAITSRTGFFLTSFQQWREVILLKEAPPTVFADLGVGVLDSAMVETAAYCLGRSKRGATTFFRILEEAEKAAILQDAVTETASHRVFHAVPATFTQVPGSPFAYWASAKLIRQYTYHSKLEHEGRTARQGLSTGNDFRYLRLWWEHSAQLAARSRIATLNTKRWVPISKGGSFSSYYYDLDLVIDWHNDGHTLKQFMSDYRGQRGWGYNWSAALNGHDFYFRPGLTWPRRTQIGLSTRILPEGCIFGDKGSSIFIENNKFGNLLQLLGLSNSSAFRQLVALQMAFGSYEVGVIQRTPVPNLDNPVGASLGELAFSCVELKRELDRMNELSHVYLLPALLQTGGETLSVRAAAWARRRAEIKAQLAAQQREIDNIAFRLYGIEGEDRRAIEEGLGGAAEENTSEADDEGDGENEALGDTTALVAALISYLAGLPFGRWDIRYATGERLVPELPDPFAPLPVCPPGMLQNAQGLPTAPEDVPPSYPLRISWPGILVDDEGNNECDIVGRVREAIQAIWGERAEAIEQEACEILGVKTLREYFRKPTLFFAEHLARYSKSRRQAPIYWPLSTPSGSYTLWLYYHRLTDQTLYSCVNDFVEPKLAHVRQELAWITQHSSGGSAEAREVERLTNLEAELQELRAELLRVAAFWKPNLNDGVQITAAPLWRLFQHKPWQKKLKETWESLGRGDYDWAHLAYSIWPERVREKCKADKSLAIAHGLEELYVEVAGAGKTKRGRKKAGAGSGGMFEGE